METQRAMDHAIEQQDPKTKQAKVAEKPSM